MLFKSQREFEKEFDIEFAELKLVPDGIKTPKGVVKFLF
jgi:acyl carrier protein